MATRAFRPLQTFLRSTTQARTRSPILSQSIAHRQFHTSPAKMTVVDATSTENFKELLADNPVVLVDFHAVWCGPCKAIAPKVQNWSKEYPNIAYVKVDVDQLADVAQEYHIRAMPTFILFKDGEKVDDMLGVNPSRLLQMIQSHHPKTEENK